eukprot:197351-Chlamydomonas_euryale.AAC.2
MRARGTHFGLSGRARSRAGRPAGARPTPPAAAAAAGFAACDETFAVGGARSAWRRAGAESARVRPPPLPLPLPPPPPSQPQSPPSPLLFHAVAAGGRGLSACVSSPSRKSSRRAVAYEFFFVACRRGAWRGGRGLACRNLISTFSPVVGIHSFRNHGRSRPGRAVY